MANELKMADKLKILGDRLFNVKNVKIIAEEETPLQRVAKSSPYQPDRAQTSNKMIQDSKEESNWKRVESSEEIEAKLQAEFFASQRQNRTSAETETQQKDRIANNLKKLNII